MIIQTAVVGEAHFIITQADHARASGQLALAFGNAQFAAPTPRDLVTYSVAHHDEGWQAIDALCEQAPSTGLPHHLTQTPLPYLLRTSTGSPDFNEQHHAYCGLLSSMHTYGLFTGRYGLSNFVFIDKVPAEHKASADALLASELNRQARLKAQLAAQPDTAAWVEERALFNNYKLLQFFDTLALYFQTTHAEARQEAQFLNVPDGVKQDYTLTLTPQGHGTYRLTPYPFASELEITTTGRYLAPQPPGTDLKALLDNTPHATQTYRLVEA